MKETNVNDFIEELGAGVFREKLAHALSEAARQLEALMPACRRHTWSADPLADQPTD